LHNGTGKYPKKHKSEHEKHKNRISLADIFLCYFPLAWIVNMFRMPSGVFFSISLALGNPRKEPIGVSLKQINCAEKYRS
jgi:hypothetical protein